MVGPPVECDERDEAVHCHVTKMLPPPSIDSLALTAVSINGETT